MVDILIIILALVGVIGTFLMADVLFSNNYELPQNLFEDEEELWP